MSHGLGTVQRRMLFRLADHELRVAEAAAMRQRPYRSPDRWSLNTLTVSTFYHRFVGPQRAAHDGWQETLRRWKPGDEDAREEVAFRVNLAHGRLNPKAEEFERHWRDDGEIQRLNPSRAILGLERRGFVLREHYRRQDTLALTAEGFVEARRLGGVRVSEIVDLNQVQANWRERGDFLLGFLVDCRDDEPPREDLRSVVDPFAHVTDP